MPVRHRDCHNPRLGERELPHFRRTPLNGATHYDPNTAEVFNREIRVASNAIDGHIRNGRRDAALLLIDDIEKYARQLRAEFNRR